MCTAVGPTPDRSAAHTGKGSTRATQLPLYDKKSCKPPTTHHEDVHVIIKQQKRRRNASIVHQHTDNSKKIHRVNSKATQPNGKQAAKPSAGNALQLTIQRHNAPAVETQLLNCCNNLITQSQQDINHENPSSGLPLLESVVVTEAVEQLQALLHMWSLYCNSTGTASMPQQQGISERVSNKQLASAKSEPACSSSHVQVLVTQAGLLLCTSVLHTAAAEPWTDIHSCQQLIMATHALGMLQIYQPTIVSECEHRVVACWHAYKWNPDQSYLEPPFTTRHASQLLAAWAALGHHPAHETLVAVLETSTHSMRAATATATTQQQTRCNDTGMDKQGSSQSSTASDESVISGISPEQAAPTALDKKGSVRLQATARALVDLADALAQLMPGCLNSLMLYDNSRSQTPGGLLVSSGGNVPSNPISAVGNSHDASIRLSHHINAAALLLPPGIPLPATSLQPITTASPGTVTQTHLLKTTTSSADPLLALWSNQQSPYDTSEPKIAETPLSASKVQTAHRHTYDSAVDTNVVGLVLNEWKSAFQECMSVHVVALNASNTSRLLDACSRLHMKLSDLTAWDTLLRAASKAIESILKDKQSIQAGNKTQEVLTSVLQSLAWLHVRSNHHNASTTGTTCWIDCSPPSNLPPPVKQVIASGMARECISQTDHRTLALFLWAAVVLLGRQGWQELQNSCHAKVDSTTSVRVGMNQGPVQPQKQLSQRSRIVPRKQCTLVNQQPKSSNYTQQQPIQDNRLPGTWEQMAFERLHGQLPFMPPSHLTQAIHAAGLLGVRPYKAWMYTLSHQIQKHKSSFDKESCLMIIWSLAVLHGPGLTPDQPTTSALVAAVSQHVPCMTRPEMQVVAGSLRTIYHRLRGHALQNLVHDLEHRIRISNA